MMMHVNSFDTYCTNTYVYTGIVPVILFTSTLLLQMCYFVHCLYHSLLCPAKMNGHFICDCCFAAKPDGSFILDQTYNHE